jgi:hypothetical protein
MTIEDGVRRVLADAVADEPPPRRAPLPAVRRRRRRPALAGAVAVVLVLAAVVGLAAVRRSDRVVPTVTPTLTTLPTAGWPGVADPAANLRFRRPPGWEVHRVAEDRWSLRPPGVPAAGNGQPGFTVTITANRGYWKTDGYWRGLAPQVGRLPGGQAYLFTVGGSPLWGVYDVDWGRVCRGAAAPGSCLPRSVHVEVRSAAAASWDRFRPQVETLVASLAPLRRNLPTTGDPSRPACRAEQWALVYPKAMAGVAGKPFLAVPVGVGFRGGPPCHLRASVLAAVEQAGRRLPLQGSPAPATIELDLPEDALPSGYRGIEDTRILQLWTWDDYCHRPASTAEIDLVVRDERGRRLLNIDTGMGKADLSGCPGSRPSSNLAAWP